MPKLPVPARVPDPSERLSATPDPPAAADAHEVVIRYWAGARQAAGVAHERVAPGTVGELLAGAQARHTGLGAVLAVCTILVGGRTVPADTQVAAGEVVEVLPPFAGG